jgi:hypothetical protein
MKQSLKIAGAATLGAGIGFAVGYKLAEKQLVSRFEERLDRETAGMKEFYTNVKKKYDTPEEAAAALIPQPGGVQEDPRVNTPKIQYNKIVKTEGYDGDPPEGCEIENPVVHKNVFEEFQDPSIPYIITQDAFMANETGYEQSTLTYYVNGDTLTDERDDVIDNADDVIGKLSTANFGEGSSDPNTVHVRNEKLRMEFEICRSERSYEEDVLGQDPSELPHQRARRQG